MVGPPDTRGILYPTRLPTFHREPAPAHLVDRIRWFWIPQWRLAPGRTSRQDVLPFPASNLVVEREGVTLSGPTTGASHRDLRGSGWAVGALLRPAGLASLSPEPVRIQDAEAPFAAPELHQAVVAAMDDPDGRADLHGATQVYAAWAVDHLAPPDQQALLANTMEDLIAADSSIVRVEQVAQQLNMSARGVQRLAQRYVGIPPLAIIRRYRLQEAAKRLREDPALTIARVAADLGYADQAHLASDFRRVLGFTPMGYRRDSTAAL